VCRRLAHNELRRHRNTLVGTIRTVESFGQQSECLNAIASWGCLTVVNDGADNSAEVMSS